MSWIVEPTITCILWKVLEEKLGLEVGSGLNVGVGFVDLIARDPTGEYIGLEVKDFSKISFISRDSRKEIKFVDQILKYMISGYFDYFYVCVEKKYRESLKITLDPTRYLSLVFPHNYPEEYERFGDYGDYLHSCGILSMPLPIKESDIDFPDLIERYPKRLTELRCSSKEPKIPKMNEARMRFDVWNHFTKINGVSPIREGVLPNLKGKKPRQIDVMVFEGSTSATEILRNQEKFDLIGIEVKSSLSNVKDILKELNLYLNSGGLTQLYLAVPPSLEENASILLEEIPSVGLITVEKGTIRIKNKAEKIEMKYDSIVLEQPGFQAYRGYPTKVSPTIIEVGWGQPAKEYELPYRYLGGSVSTEREKKEIVKEKQTKTLDTWIK